MRLITHYNRNIEIECTFAFWGGTNHVDCSSIKSQIKEGELQMNRLRTFKISGFSDLGKDHEIEQALMNLLMKNQLLPTNTGDVVDFHTVEVEHDSTADEDDISGVKDDPVKIKKRTTGNGQ